MYAIISDPLQLVAGETDTIKLLLYYAWGLGGSTMEWSPSSLSLHLAFTSFSHFSALPFALHSMSFGPQDCPRSLATSHLLRPSFLWSFFLFWFVFLTWGSLSSPRSFRWAASGHIQFTGIFHFIDRFLWKKLLITSVQKLDDSTSNSILVSLEKWELSQTGPASRGCDQLLRTPRVGCARGPTPLALLMSPGRCPQVTGSTTLCLNTVIACVCIIIGLVILLVHDQPIKCRTQMSLVNKYSFLQTK